MAETEVESILREIRERVIAQQRDSQVAAVPHAAITNGSNGNSGTQDPAQTVAAENLRLIDSYLTTTARSWDRLPPIVSNRSGPSAKLELWLKRQIKAATHWFTWEQVNFNAAVHHGLRDLVVVLTAYEQELAKLRAQIEAEAEARRSDLEQNQTEFTAQRNQLEARIAELVSELRERDQHLRDEQRVCFKQLSLETSEAAVLEDRARRKSEALLEELQRRIERFEKGSKS